MPRFSAEQIYSFARQAGFSPDQAATMTAVALAESGGNSRAHNPVGEDSRGLWQINARAHPDLAQRLDLYDPADNAKAAFEVSRQGRDFSPWTTTHNLPTARYLRFQEEAQAAAVAHGDGAGRGVWTGTSGYGDHRGAGAPDGAGGDQTPSATPAAAVDPAATAGPADDAPATGDADLAARQGGTDDRRGAEYGIPQEGGGGDAGRDYGLPLDTPGGEDAATGPQPAATGDPAAAAPTAAVPPPPGTPAGGTPAGGDKLDRFVDAALAQNGDRYIYGAEVRMGDSDPKAFDCSELVEWAAHQAGLSITDGALGQFRQLHNAGTGMSVEEALRTRGALLFNFSSDPVTGQPTGQHVAISLGDGHTIEARNRHDGVGVFEASARRFNYAAMIPGTSGGAPAAPEAARHAPAVAADEPAQTPRPARVSDDDGRAHQDGQAFSAGPRATEPEPDAFDRRVAADPDQLDRDTLPASLEFTGPTAPIIPAPTDAPDTAEPPDPGTAHDTPALDDSTGGFHDELPVTVDWVDLGSHHHTGHGTGQDSGHDAAPGGH